MRVNSESEASRSERQAKDLWGSWEKSTWKEETKLDDLFQRYKASLLYNIATLFRDIQAKKYKDTNTDVAKKFEMKLSRSWCQEWIWKRSAMMWCKIWLCLVLEHIRNMSCRNGKLKSCSTVSMGSGIGYVCSVPNATFTTDVHNHGVPISALSSLIMLRFSVEKILNDSHVSNKALQPKWPIHYWGEKRFATTQADSSGSGWDVCFCQRAQVCPSCLIMLSLLSYIYLAKRYFVVQFQMATSGSLSFYISKKMELVALITLSKKEKSTESQSTFCWLKSYFFDYKIDWQS